MQPYLIDSGGSSHRHSLLLYSSRPTPGTLGMPVRNFRPHLHTSAAISLTGSRTSVSAAPAAAIGAAAASGSTWAAGLLVAAVAAQAAMPPLRLAAASPRAAAGPLATVGHVQGEFSGARRFSTGHCPRSRTSGLGRRSWFGCAFFLSPWITLGLDSDGGCGRGCISCGSPYLGPCACLCFCGSPGLRSGLGSHCVRGPGITSLWSVPSLCCVLGVIGRGRRRRLPSPVSRGFGPRLGALRRCPAGSAQIPTVCRSF